MSTPDKSAALMARVDLDRPELADVRTAPAFVDHLARPPRPRYRFEYEQKAEMLAFLTDTYESWRAFDTAPADRVASLTIAQAQGPRALAGVPALGQAWWATGDPKYGAAFQRFYLETATGEMFDWDAFNGSQGAIELDAFFLLQDCPAFTPEGRIAFLDHLCAISDYAWDDETSQWKQLGLGTEGHNWYLHGMHVLPFIGLLFPEFKRSDFFLRTGWSVVEDHVRGHYKSDGGARETTLGYQAGSMRCLWDFYLIAERNGWPVSPGFAERLLNATKFLLRLASPAGGLPSFGDGGHAPGGLTALAATAAALSGDGECKWFAEYGRGLRAGVRGEAAGRIPEDAFWKVGLAGARTYAETRARNPHQTSVLMGPTGYAALRDGDGPDACYLAVAAADRGPIVTSHGHNDIFSIDVHAGGVRFIGEMGCAPYGETPGRDYDQKTEAHSTLAIEGMEQTPLLSEWRWDGRTIPAVRRWVSDETHEFFHGVHEGYYQYRRHETLHARKIFFLKAGPRPYWIIMDWLESAVENDYRVYFHGCVPGAADGDRIVLGEGEGGRLAIVPPAGDALALSRVSSDGLSAYIAEKKLDADRYPCFAYARRAASHGFVWVLVPTAPGEALPTVRRLPMRVNGIDEDAHGATAVEIGFGGYTDTLGISHKDFDGTLEFGALSAWGNLAFRRTDGAGTCLLSIDQTMADGVCGR